MTNAATDHQTTGEKFRAHAATAEDAAPDMQFKTHAEKPHAKIVLQAETHEQLNEILIALNRAVNSYQSRSDSNQTAPSTESQRADARH